MKSRVPAPANDHDAGGLHPARALARMIFQSKMRGPQTRPPEHPHEQLRHIRSLLERPAE